jgi:hypothetical protein
MVVYTCNPSTRETEAGECRVPGQHGSYRQILCQEKTNQPKTLKNQKNNKTFCEEESGSSPRCGLTDGS